MDKAESKFESCGLVVEYSAQNREVVGVILVQC